MGWGDIPGDAIRLIRTHGTDGMERLGGYESRAFIVLYRVTTGSIRSEISLLTRSVALPCDTMKRGATGGRDEHAPVTEWSGGDESPFGQKSTIVHTYTVLPDG